MGKELSLRIERPSVREGYDIWSETYDRTPNPVVAMDARFTLGLLDARPGERILDAGCGTGRNTGRLAELGSRPVGLDFSHHGRGSHDANPLCGPKARREKTAGVSRHRRSMMPSARGEERRAVRHRVVVLGFGWSAVDLDREGSGT